MQVVKQGLIRDGRGQLNIFRAMNLSGELDAGAVHVISRACWRFWNMGVGMEMGSLLSPERIP